MCGRRFNLILHELPSPLNPLLVCLSHAWGGLEQVAAQDALDLAEAGFAVNFLCFDQSPLHQKIAGHPLIQPIALDFSPRNYGDLRLRAEILRALGQGVNLIHTHQPSLLGSIVPWVWNRRGVGLLATRHIMNNHNKKDFIHRALYSRVDALVVVSQAIRASVLQTHAIQEKKVKVIHLGLDFQKFDPAKVSTDAQRQAWGVGSEDLLVGLVGRIDPAKGQATFIRAASGLLRQLSLGARQQLKFLVIGEPTRGSGGQHLAELKEMVNQFRLGDSIVFTGYQNNIPQVMGALDLVVMPSRQEAFGLVAIEAMAMGCPVVVSRGGSAKEIVGDEDYGLTVRPDDAFDLQRQLRFLLENKDLRTQMGHRARAYVQASYDRRQRLTQTLSLYERILKRRRPQRAA
jgi:glycosyltransferase involved in cell wall biosynthesis